MESWAAWRLGTASAIFLGGEQRVDCDQRSDDLASPVVDELSADSNLHALSCGRTEFSSCKLRDFDLDGVMKEWEGVAL